MIRVDKGRIAPGCLVALILVISESTYADTLSCVAERASGFVYDEQSESWQATVFSIENRKYLVQPANEDDIVASALKYDYEVKDAGSAKSVILCKSIKLPDTNQETGLIMCKGPFGGTFNIDKVTGRYIRSQTTGYVTRQASTSPGNGPYLEIGSCIPN